MHDIQELKRQGLSICQIAAHTGFNRRTVRKYLAHPAIPRYPRRAPRPTRLDPYRAFIEQRLQAGVWNARVLLRTERSSSSDCRHSALSASHFSTRARSSTESSPSR